MGASIFETATFMLGDKDCANPSGSRKLTVGDERLRPGSKPPHTVDLRVVLLTDYLPRPLLEVFVIERHLI